MIEAQNAHNVLIKSLYAAHFETIENFLRTDIEKAGSQLVARPKIEVNDVTEFEL